MDIDLTRNYFELFGFSESFDIDQDELARKYRSLQSALHPDRFASASDQERRVAVQTTAFVNEAFVTLKSDLKRAHYLLKLKNIDFDADTETSNDAEFLMQQMEFHERVEELDQSKDPLEALEVLSQEFKQQQAQLIAEFSTYRIDRLRGQPHITRFTQHGGFDDSHAGWGLERIIPRAPPLADPIAMS